MTEARQLDLIDDAIGGYPESPGWKAEETSRQAAEDIKPKVATLRAMALAKLRDLGPLTADEIADHMNESILTVRPRISELRAKGLIEKTDVRRPNSSGKSAIVWRAT